MTIPAGPRTVNTTHQIDDTQILDLQTEISAFGSVQPTTMDVNNRAKSESSVHEPARNIQQIDDIVKLHNKELATTQSQVEVNQENVNGLKNQAIEQKDNNNDYYEEDDSNFENDPE